MVLFSSPLLSHYLTFIKIDTTMSLSFRVFRCVLSALCCLLVSQHVYAAKKSSQDFASWLETYQAWDVYEQELSTQSPSPKNILARAATLVRLNKPQQVLDLLIQPFCDHQDVIIPLFLVGLRKSK